MLGECCWESGFHPLVGELKRQVGAFPASSAATEGGAWPKSGPRWSEVCKQEQLGISSGGGSGSLCPGPSSPWAVREASIWWWRGLGGRPGVPWDVQGQQRQQLPPAQAVLNDPDAMSGWVPFVPRPSSKPGSPAILTILSGPPWELDF